MSRRLKAFQISPQAVLSSITSKSFTRCASNDIPEDAIFHSCYYEHDCQSFFIVVEHPAFREVPEGEVLERVFPVIELQDATELEQADISHLGVP